ncbi:hypothetical protein Goshw_001401 [Gossypium schwendimanii]|uniref:Uncharacterized protein n=1 Tax=Gossypium schwendimanii TaxID=34291 RepID=A0A7J9M0A9_GOSSC|nr:hypothetical protein [Gossypium schwendimanii]
MANQLKERQCLVVATGFDIFTVSQTFSNAGWVIENRTALQKVEWMVPISSCSGCCAYAGWMVLLCWLLCGLPFQLSGLFELSSSSVDYFVVDDVIHRTVGPAGVVFVLDWFMPCVMHVRAYENGRARGRHASEGPADGSME